MDYFKTLYTRKQCPLQDIKGNLVYKPWLNLSSKPTKVDCESAPKLSYPLKWVGGKRQVCSQLVSQFPQDLTYYYEPFVGGGSVLLTFLYIKKSKGAFSKCKKVYASDANANLINFWMILKDYPEEVFNTTQQLLIQLQQLPDIPLSSSNAEIKKKRKPMNIKEAQYCRETFYYWIRTQYNKTINNQGDPEGLQKLRVRKRSSQAYNSKDAVKIASYFLFLNKTCFRGLYREGPSGFNVPYGHYKNPGKHISLEGFIAISSLIQEVTFYHGDYSTIPPINSENSWDAINLLGTSNIRFFYLDPPYVPVKDTSFTNYINPKITQPSLLSVSSNATRSEAKLSSTLCSQPMIANATRSEARIPIKLSTFNDRLSHLKFLSYVESLIKIPGKLNVTSSEAVPSTGELGLDLGKVSQDLVTNITNPIDSNQAANLKGSTSITKFLITNSNTPLVNNWADSLNLNKEVYTSKRTIHSKNPSSVASELIIRNYRISLSTHKMANKKEA